MILDGMYCPMMTRKYQAKLDLKMAEEDRKNQQSRRLFHPKKQEHHPYLIRSFELLARKESADNFCHRRFARSNSRRSLRVSDAIQTPAREQRQRTDRATTSRGPRCRLALP
jgi:hypothetical protein